MIKQVVMFVVMGLVAVGCVRKDTAPVDAGTAPVVAEGEGEGEGEGEASAAVTPVDGVSVEPVAPVTATH